MSYEMQHDTQDVEFAQREAELGWRATRGDVESVGPMYEFLADRIKYAVHRSFNNYPPTEDVVHDTFEKAHMAIQANKFTYRGKGSLYNWLMKIAFNAAISSRRRSDRTFPADFGSFGFEQAAPGDFTEEVVQQDYIDSLLANTRPERAEVIRAVDIDGTAYKDYAVEHGLPIGTVSTRLHRGRNDLREALE